MNSQFAPIYSSTVTLSVSTTSSSVALSGMSARPQNIVITNAGTALVFVVCGVGPQTATTANLPILPSSAVVLSIDPSADTLAAITASGAATLYATVGNGE